MRRLLCIICLMPMLLLEACEQQSNNASSPQSATQRDASTPQSNVAPDVRSRSRNTSKVTLAFDQVPLEDVAPVLQEHSGKRVTISPQFSRMRPKYTLTLISSEAMTRDEAFTRVLAKLRSDGLDVLETEDSIDINLGNCLSVWKPEWQLEVERTRPGMTFDPPVIDLSEPEQVEPDALGLEPPPALTQEDVDRMDKPQIRESLRQVAAARKKARDPELQARLKQGFEWLMNRLRELG